MKTLLIAAILTLSTFAGASDKKPTVCVAYAETQAIVDGKQQKVAVCSDNKKPFVLTSYSPISLVTPDGSTVKAIVGWR